MRVLTECFDAQPDCPFIDGYMARERMLLGEFGALARGPRSVAADRDDRLRYLADMRRSAEAQGFAWEMWSLFDGFQALRRGTPDR